MAKCSLCGNSGLTLKLDFDGHCLACHSLEIDAAKKEKAEMQSRIDELQRFHDDYMQIPNAHDEAQRIIGDATAEAARIIEDAKTHSADVEAKCNSEIRRAQSEIETKQHAAEAELRQIKLTAKKTIADANQSIASLLSIAAQDFAFSARAAASKPVSPSKPKRNTKSDHMPVIFLDYSSINRIIEETENGFVIFDLETTGLSPDRERIIEIGAIKCEATGVPLERFSSLVNPGIKIPVAASAVNHIYDDMVQDAPKAIDILPKFMDFVGDLPLIAHNASFDIGFLENELSRSSVSTNQHVIDYIDTLSLAKELYSLPSYRLGAIAQHLCLASSGAHRSGSDCETLRQVFSCMRREIASKQGI